MVPSAAVAMVSATVTGAFQCLQTQSLFLSGSVGSKAFWNFCVQCVAEAVGY